MSITPGPVNTVILSTSLNHGLKRSLPIFQVPPLALPCFLIFSGLWPSKCIDSAFSCLKNFCSLWNVFVCYIGIKLFLFCCQYFNFKCTCRALCLFPILKMVSYYIGLTQKRGWLVCRALLCLASIENTQSLPIFIMVYFHLLCLLVLLGTMWR